MGRTAPNERLNQGGITTKKTFWSKWKNKIKLWGRLILNWRFLLCFGIAWMITNGWSYLLLGIGMWMEHAVLIGIASAYLAFLWLPISPEKIVTFAISLFLIRWLFPKHKQILQKQMEEASAKEGAVKKEKRPEESAD